MERRRVPDEKHENETNVQIQMIQSPLRREVRHIQNSKNSQTFALDNGDLY